MKLQSFINSLEYKLRYGSTVEWYNFWYIVLRRKHKITPCVESIEKTISTIIEGKKSVSRFGDGEVLLTNPNKAIRFQEGNPLLARRLSEILQSQEEGHLVCVSDTFSQLYRYNRKARRFWRTHFFLYSTYWDKLLQPGRIYYNTLFTRPYMDFASKSACKNWFQSMRAIWKDRDVIFIEGEKSRLGVGNDLFDDARSIRRILCPPQNAFSRYDDILQEAMKHEKEALYLVALGPTATVLAYDLFKSGRQAVDIGHVDVEYEWWQMQARSKVRLEKKYVNETANGSQVTDAGAEYEQQIIAKIL